MKSWLILWTLVVVITLTIFFKFNPIDMMKSQGEVSYTIEEIKTDKVFRVEFFNSWEADSTFVLMEKVIDELYSQSYEFKGSLPIVWHGYTVGAYLFVEAK